MNVTALIAKKRDGLELDRKEIEALVGGFLSGAVSEAQMAALLMAIGFNGMSDRETAALTFAMVNSGRRLDLSGIPGVKVDKHSTGGVGDKTTLVVAPLAAAFGVRVPKMSGRALGHTGGTIDKLECIPGLTTDLSPERFCRQVEEIGLAIAAAGPDLAPADKKIYALRDATATVESIPLIASSVMSKKLAVGADAMVIDVKVGKGALLTDLAQAQELARTMVELGKSAGKRVICLVTRMDQPLGAAVGDALELAEAVATLQGRGPSDFVELCELVAGYMLYLGGAAGNPDEGRELARHGLASGQGLKKLREMVIAQGGRGETIDHPDELLQGTEQVDVIHPQEGFITEINAREIGLAVRNLKDAAQANKSTSGVILHKKVGHEITGEPVATIIVPTGTAAECAVQEIRQAFSVGPAASSHENLLFAVFGD